MAVLVRQWCPLTSQGKAVSQEEALKCNFCTPAAVGEMPSSNQAALYYLSRPREGIYLVPARKGVLMGA